MSSFAFSHKFSQRWVKTPANIKQVITHELEDIANFLQSPIDVENYQFRVNNIHETIEQLMSQQQEQEQQRLAEEQAKKQQEQQEKQRLEAEQAKKEQKKREQEQLEKPIKEAKEKPDEKSAQESHHQAPPSRLQNMLNPEKMTERMMRSLTNRQNPPIPDHAKIKQEIYDVLQTHLDDYIQDSVNFMKDELHKWLQEEIENQLNNRLPTDPS